MEGTEEGLVDGFEEGNWEGDEEGLGLGIEVVELAEGAVCTGEVEGKERSWMRDKQEDHIKKHSEISSHHETSVCTSFGYLPNLFG